MIHPEIGCKMNSENGLGQERAGIHQKHPGAETLNAMFDYIPFFFTDSHVRFVRGYHLMRFALKHSHMKRLTGGPRWPSLMSHLGVAASLVGGTCAALIVASILSLHCSPVPGGGAFIGDGHMVFAHATSRLGRVQPHKSSHMTCHGSDAYSRVCHFQSVCWDRSDRTFVYYRDPSTFYSPAASTEESEATAGSNHSIWASTPGEFVAVGKFGIEKWPGLKRPQDLFLPLVERPGPIPTSAEFAPEAVHVFFRSFWAENFGHALGDDMLPAFALMSKFGLLTRDVKLLTPNDIAQTCLESGSSDVHRRAKKILRDWAAILSNHAIGEMSEEPMYTYTPPGADSAPRHTCLTSLLVGHSVTGMLYDRDQYFSAFIDHMIRSAIQQYPPVRQAAELRLDRQRVVIIEKRGRRALLNAAELAAHIRATFRVQVSVVNPAELTLIDQIALMLSSTLVVTPPGGISFACAFVRARMPVIFIGYWSPTKGRSELLEGYLWPHVRRIVSLHYEVQRSEVTVLAPGNASRASEWDYQFNGATLVDLKRMTPLVASGLSIAQRELGLRVPSFHRGS